MYINAELPLTTSLNKLKRMKMRDGLASLKQKLDGRFLKMMDG